MVLSLLATGATALMLAVYARVEPAYVVLGWIGFVPWLAAVDRTRSLGAAALLGVLLSELFVAALFPWIPRGISDYSGGSWIVTVAVTALIAPILQPQFILTAVARNLTRRFGADWLRVALVGACAYVATEWIVPKLFADTLGQALYAAPLLCQAADLFGTAGLTFLLLFVNDLVLAAITLPGRRIRALAAAATIVLALAAYGAFRLAQLEGATVGTPPIRAAIIQANISHYDRMAEEIGTFEAVRRILDAHFTMSAHALEGHDVDLLLWPETVYPTSFGAPKSADGAAFDRAIGAFVANSRVPLLFGTYERDGVDEFNVAVLLEPGDAGHVAFDSYRKTTLFPFTEYVPAWLDTPWLRARWPWMGHWKAGRGPAVLAASLPHGGAVKLAPLICYDAIDPGFVSPAVRQGAEVLVTLSNDSWFAYPGVQRLILIVSAFRSIETRRPQLRVTTTGISAVIGATGVMIDTIGLDETGTLIASVPPAHGQTLMTRWGNWFPAAALLGGMVLLGATVWRQNAWRPRALS